jgi:hypothetical protein
MSFLAGLPAAAQFVGPGLGLLLVAVGLHLAARPATDDSARGRLDRICCSLILFSLAAAAMASLGRVNASAAFQIPLRYAVMMAPLHIGVLVLLVIRNPASNRLSKRALLAAFTSVLVLGVCHQALGSYVILRYCTNLNRILAEFNAGRRSPEMTQYVYPTIRHAEEVSAEMKRRGVYQ